MQSSEGRANYGNYEGPQGYMQQQQYEAPRQQPQSTYDDNMTEAVAQRVAQLLNTSGAQGKIRAERNKMAGYRLALAIVSLGIMVPLAGIIFGTGSGLVGMFVFGGICLFILLINVVFNFADRS
jgi:hypothetical protein